MAVIAAGQPAPEFSLATVRRRAVHPRGPRGRDDGPRLLPVRVLAGLHRPAEPLRGGAGRLRRARRDALRRLLRRHRGPSRRSGAARRRRSSSSRTSSPRAPRAAPSACCTRAASRSARSCCRPRRASCAGATRRASPGDAARRQPHLRRARRLPERTSAPPRCRPSARRPRPRAGGRAAGRRLRRLRVPVLRGARAAPARARRSAWRSATSRCAPSHPRASPAACAAEAAAAPGRLLADARRAVRRPGPARGPAPVGARRGARPRRRALRRRPPRPGGRRARHARTSAAGSAPASRPRRRCSSTASCTPGARTTPCGRGCDWALGPRSTRGYVRPRANRAGRAMPSDAQLVERMRTDDTGEALRALYRTYAGELLGSPERARRPRGGGGDRAGGLPARLAPRRALRPHARRVRTWLYQIARNAIIDARRRAAVRPGARAATSRGDERGAGGLARAGDARLAGRRRAGAALARAPPGDPPGPVPGA